MTPSELRRYFARVGYEGPREPTLDVLLGRGIDLGEDALLDKLVERRRGGYCFEQNGLFLAVLTAVGFDVTPLSARVRLDRPREFTPPRTHLFLRVVIDGVPFLTDVGVGGLSLTAAIRFETGPRQSTPHEPRRIVHEDGRYFHQARLGSEWVDVYEFTGEAMPPVDREVANWYTSAHPQSHFKNRLIVARAGDDGVRYTLLNDELKVRGRDGRAVVTPIESDERLLALLSEHFGLAFPAGTRFPLATG